MNRQIKVMIASAECGEGAVTEQATSLKRMYELSDERYGLVHSPDAADVILICDLAPGIWVQSLRRNRLVNKYIEKCFLVNEDDQPTPVLRGIYAVGSRSLFGRGRVRAGSYALYPKRFLNPFVLGHTSSAQDLGRQYLLTFVGRNSHRIRDDLFSLNFDCTDILIENSTQLFDIWAVQGPDGRLPRQKHYYNLLLSSKFSLCPRGTGPTSIRLFESMQLGIAPVIVSDEWNPPRGPKWNDFSLTVKEKHVLELEKIVRSYETSYREMGCAAHRAFEEYFADHAYFNYAVGECIDIMKTQLVPEKFYWQLGPWVVRAGTAKKAQIDRAGRLCDAIARSVAGVFSSHAG